MSASVSSTVTCPPAEEDHPKLGNYTVLQFLGEGSYGKVVKCFNSTTKEVVAVKVFEDDYEMQMELNMIQHLRNIDPDEVNIVKYIEHFTYEKYHCIVYEILDCSLLDLAMNCPGPLPLSEMRPVAQQLLVAFKALKEAQIVHGDLKPDNIMLVNHQEQPFKVKLIDFGCGGLISDLEQGMDIMCDGYRAPEVTLGAPLSEALEMWSLGCCLGEGFLVCPLFSDVSSYDHLRTIIHLLGKPSDEMLQRSIYADKYFLQTNIQWRFKSPIEYQATNWKKPEVSVCELDQFSNLEEAIMAQSDDKDEDAVLDLEVFLDFLKNLLQVDPEKRLTVDQALRHPFITMEHLIYSDSEYVQGAHDLMAVTLKTSNQAEGNPDQDPQSSAALLESPGSSLAFRDVSSPPEDHHMSSESEEFDSSYSSVTKTDIDSFMGNDDVSFIIQPVEKNNLCMDTNVTDPDLLWDKEPVLFWFEMDQSDEASSCLNEEHTAESEHPEITVGDSSEEANTANNDVHKGPVLFWFEMDQSDEVSSCLNEEHTAESEHPEITVGDSSEEANTANNGVHKGPVLFWFEMDQSDEASSCLNEEHTAESEHPEITVGDSSEEANTANNGVHKGPVLFWFEMGQSDEVSSCKSKSPSVWSGTKKTFGDVIVHLRRSMTRVHRCSTSRRR